MHEKSGIFICLVFNMVLRLSQAQVSSCPISAGWLLSGSSQCLLVSTEQGPDTLSWEDAKDMCTGLYPGASLASMPTDVHDNNLAARLTPDEAYWVGMRIPASTTNSLVWLDGSLETRKSLFAVSTTISVSLSYLCGHVVLSIVTLQPLQMKLTWTLDDCSANHSYVCLMNEGMATTPSTALAVVSQESTTDSSLASSAILANVTVSAATSAIIQDRLHCTKTSAVECLVDAVNLNSVQLLDEGREADLVSSSEMLMEELSHVDLQLPNVDHLTVLSDFLYVMDAMIHVSSDSRNPAAHERIDDVLAKAEDFLDNMMTNARELDFDQDYSLTLPYIDLLVTRSPLGAIHGKKLLMKSGSITIDSIHHSALYNSTASAIMSALVLHVPKTEVWLTQGGEMVRALVVSPVLSLTAVVDRYKASLSHTFSLAVQSFQNNTNEPLCGFQMHNGSDEIWDIHGCVAVTHITLKDSFALHGGNNTNDTSRSSSSNTNNSSSDNTDDDLGTSYVECACNHTTNFAVLMQIVSFPISAKDELVLSIITYIGCSITIITQIMAITVFTCIRSLNSERVCVHRNLCISIMAAQIAFISGIKAVEDKILCALVAVILHYFYIASFVWMLVEGLHLYSKVVRVFGTEKSRILYYICFGWGIPLILVAVSAAVDWEGYGTPDSCWLSTQRSTIWAFVGPAVAIMIVNFVILMIVLRIVVTSAKMEKHDDHEHIRAGVKAALFLIPLLGLTWMFGLAAVSKDLIVFQYIFAILNSLQGFFIFLCHCVFNSEVRNTLKRMREKRSLQKGEFPVTSSTSNGRPSSSDSRSPTAPPVTRRESTSPVFRRVNQVGPSPVQRDDTAANEWGKQSSNTGNLTLMYI